MSALFDLLPAIYRIRDAGQGDPLRALFEVIEGEVRRVENDIAGLYDNWFIETCDEWVVPYIGDLLGVRNLLPVTNSSFTQRSYIANAIEYRQGKGTVRVLEQLGRDLTGWPCRAVEFFERLATTQHVNHVRLYSPATVDVRSPFVNQFVGTPFEECNHTAEVRHIDNLRGKYNIPNVGLFLWKLQSYLLTGVTARKLDNKRYFFNPLGINTALFNLPATEANIAQITGPTNVPMPISRLSLHHDLTAYYGSDTEVRSLLIKDTGAANPVRPASSIVVCNLSDAAAGAWAHAAPTGKIAIDPQLGRIAFSTAPAGDVEVSFAYGFGGDMGGGPYDRRQSLEEELTGGITWQMGVTKKPPAGQTVVVSKLLDAVKAWNLQPAGSRGLIALMDNGTYEEDLKTAANRIKIPQGSLLIIAAADWPEEAQDDPITPRARIVGHISPAGIRTHLKGTIEVAGTAAADSPAPGTLILSGLLLEGDLVIIAGNLGRLDVRDSTLAPPPASAGGFSCKTNPNLEIAFTRSISRGLAPTLAARSLRIMDSIVDGALDARQAIIEASTVMGTVTSRELTASNSIITGKVTTERRQVGCVRFSWLPFNSESPRRYRCQPTDSKSSVEPEFVSVTYGDPGYTQLASTCPQEITTGADDEGEMGAWHWIQSPQRLRNLRSALDEYLRFGLEAGIFIVPQHAIAPDASGANQRRLTPIESTEPKPRSRSTTRASSARSKAPSRTPSKKKSPAPPPAKKRRKKRPVS